MSSDELKLVVNHEKHAALMIDDRDNTAVALQDIPAGKTCIVRKGPEEFMVTVHEKISFGHKLALVDLNKDEAVYKYGEMIGRMMTPVHKGNWIHNHNMYCERGINK
ncbi:UxaA family hydrolase [Alteribacillus sp. HJP-4]|uniref:UxaA family hydrolase n=1 Tax=Alteribacillus sp. HJP-4 TaxID=2775394 RepID=UPI0035CD33A2